MKLNVYKNQNEIEKTFERASYDIMYGTAEDVFQVLEGLDESSSDADLIKAIAENRNRLNELLMDIFPGLTKEDLRKVKIKELVALFVDLVLEAKNIFGAEEKN